MGKPNRTTQRNELIAKVPAKPKGNGKSKDKRNTNNTREIKMVVYKTEDLKHDIFYYGDGMANKFSTSKKSTYLEYATREFFRRVKKNQSRMEHSPLPRWMKESTCDKCPNKKLEQLLPYMQQLTYTKDYEKYQKKKETLQKKNLSKLYQNLWDACQSNFNREDPSSSIIHLTWNDRTLGNAQCD